MAISTSKSWQSILEQATKRSHDLDSGMSENMAQVVRYGLPKAAPVKVQIKNDPAGFLSPDLEQELQDQVERALVGLRGGSW